MSSSFRQKTPEEIDAERKLNDLIDTTAPKGFGQGMKRGVGNILSGAVGAVGVAVLMPTLGLAAGYRQAGIVGGIFGVAGGAVAGVIGAAVVAVGGALS